MKVEKFEDGAVTKYVFIKEDACYEAVLYKYPTYQERTVLCISTQCGCPVGCTFCATGKRFIRNLTALEIIKQVEYIYLDIGRIVEGGLFGDTKEDGFIPKKGQIMMMSMGEPMLNYDNVDEAIHTFNKLYPKEELLLSTIAPNNPEAFNKFLNTSIDIKKTGLQFSIHKSNDTDRDVLIPFKNKMNLAEIRDYGIQWYAYTHRPVYLNYCIDGTNNTIEDAEALMNMFSPTSFALTFSVVCSTDENNATEAGYHDLEQIRKFEELFIKRGYNTRVFDPAGQSFGNGCGQLFFVQRWMKENGRG